MAARLGRSLGLSVLALLPGCAAQENALLYANADVRIQVCAPTQRIYFNDLRLEQLENHPLFTKYSPEQLARAPNTIRRAAPADDPRVLNDPRAVKNYGVTFGEVLNRSGYSAGSGFMPVRDSTVGDQPVYEKGYGYRAAQYVAVSVRFFGEDPAKAPTYWFKLPKSIPADGFSDWIPPASMEPGHESSEGAIWYRLVSGRDLPILPVSAGAPKIRVAFQKTLDRHDDPTNDSLPALTTARMRLRTPTSGRQFVYEFVAKTDEAIPRCD